MQLNIAMAVAAVPITCGLLWIALRVDCPCNRYAVRVETLRVSVDSWMRCEVSQKCIHARRALWVAKSLASSGIAVLVLALTLGLLLVLLKSDIFLGSQYSTYQLQYGWTFSAAYLHDTAPVVLCMLCLWVQRHCCSEHPTPPGSKNLDRAQYLQVFDYLAICLLRGCQFQISFLLIISASWRSKQCLKACRISLPVACQRWSDLNAQWPVLVGSAEK